MTNIKGGEEKKLIPDLTIHAKVRLEEVYKNPQTRDYGALISVRREIKCGGWYFADKGTVFNINIPLTERKYLDLKKKLEDSDVKNPEIGGKATLEFVIQRIYFGILV